MLFISWYKVDLFGPPERLSFLDSLKFVENFKALSYGINPRSDAAYLWQLMSFYSNAAYLIPIGFILYIGWIAFKGATDGARAFIDAFSWAVGVYIFVLYWLLMLMKSILSAQRGISLSYSPYVIFICLVVMNIFIEPKIKPSDKLFR
jgi:hypothetical protein